MMKWPLKILLLIPVIYLAIVPAYFTHKLYTEPCSKIAVTIADSSDYNFVTGRDILNILAVSNRNPIGKPLKEIRLDEIENTMSGFRELKIAEAYFSTDGILHIFADQRRPIMRVMANNGGDYYVDTEGVVVRRKHLYTPRLHVVGGNVNVTQAMLNGVSVLDTSIRYTILKDIFYLVDYINRDSFWSAQIDQIYVDSYDEIDLIPRVGNHIIHLGSAEDFRQKFQNLRVFYDKVMPEVGWDKYSNINLAFRDQIVCRLR